MSEHGAAHVGMNTNMTAYLHAMHLTPLHYKPCTIMLDMPSFIPLPTC